MRRGPPARSSCGGDGASTEAQFARLKSELETNYQGAANAGRPLLLEGGLDWKPLSLSPKDMDFVEAKNAAAREIALAFGVPPLLLGLAGRQHPCQLRRGQPRLLPPDGDPARAPHRRGDRAMAAAGLGETGPAAAFEPDLDAIEALAAERKSSGAASPAPTSSPPTRSARRWATGAHLSPAGRGRREAAGEGASTSPRRGEVAAKRRVRAVVHRWIRCSSSARIVSRTPASCGTRRHSRSAARESRTSPTRACGVHLRRAHLSRVGCAVDLDDELRVEADEIDDILIDRPLPAEFPSGESAIAQRLPELRLGAGL